MYAVIELQKNNGVLSLLTFTYEDEASAMQKYHEILSFAAVSTVELHSAALLEEDGTERRCESYEHRPKEAAETV